MQPQWSADKPQLSFPLQSGCQRTWAAPTNRWAVTDLTCVCAPSSPPQSYAADVAAAALEAERSELQSQLQGSGPPHVQHAALAQQAGLQPPAQWTDQLSFVQLHHCLREEDVTLQDS
jgi:hypothetical protein